MRKAIVQYTKTHVLILCNKGHLLEANKLDSTYGGSMLEAELGFRHKGDRFDRLAQQCQGYGHEPEPYMIVPDLNTFFLLNI